MFHKDDSEPVATETPDQSISPQAKKILTTIADQIASKKDPWDYHVDLWMLPGIKVNTAGKLTKNSAGILAELLNAELIRPTALRCGHTGFGESRRAYTITDLGKEVCSKL